MDLEQSVREEGTEDDDDECTVIDNEECGDWVPVREDIRRKIRELRSFCRKTDEGIFKCPLCSCTREFLSGVLQHVSSFHFRSEISAKRKTDVEELHCSLCQKTFTKKNTALAHFGVVHGDALGLALDAIRTSSSAGPELNPIEDSTAEKVVEKEVVVNGGKNEEDTDHSFECYLCSDRFSEKNEVLSHLSVSHFQSELLQSCDRSWELTCHICEKMVGDEEELASHVGAEHKMVLILILQEGRETDKRIAHLFLTDKQLHRTRVRNTKSVQDMLRRVKKLSSVGPTSRHRRAGFKWRCRYCGHQTRECYNLLQHMSYHFRREIGARHREEVAEGRCRACNVDLRQDLMVRHFGSVHKEVLEMVLETPPESDRWEKFGKALGKTVEEFECPLCKGKERSSRSLKSHLARVHYKKQMLKDLAKDAKRRSCTGTIYYMCQFCLNDKRLDTTSLYIGHVGAAHDKILDYLPPELKSSVQDESKRPKTKKKVLPRNVPCPMCFVPQKTVYRLRVHLVYSHCYREISSKFGNPIVCPGNKSITC